MDKFNTFNYLATTGLSNCSKMQWMVQKWYSHFHVSINGLTASLHLTITVIILTKNTEGFFCSLTTTFTISEYISSDHFENRAPNGVSTEIIGIRQFLRFLESRNYIKKDIHHACFSRQNRSRRIVSAYTDKQAEILCREQRELPTNLRNRAVYLLALKCGLHTCDIMNLKFRGIDFNNKTIHLVQKKTKEALVIPFDTEVSNALVRYILEERRECGGDHVFVAVTGPARKLTHYSSFWTATRFRDTEGYDKPVHDGLHILRRTFASSLLKTGTGVSQIASALGHTDMGAVERYLAVEKDKMRKCSLSIDNLPYKGGLY